MISQFTIEMRLTFPEADKHSGPEIVKAAVKKAAQDLIFHGSVWDAECEVVAFGDDFFTGRDQIVPKPDPYKIHKELAQKLPTLEELKNHDMDEINKAIINKAIDVRIEAMLRAWGITPATFKGSSLSAATRKYLSKKPIVRGDTSRAKLKRLKRRSK